MYNYLYQFFILIMNLISLLFSTSSNNLNPIPIKNRFILGISSLWILFFLPFSFSFLLSFNIFLISFFSPLFWFSYNINSFIHKFDKFFAWSIFFIIFYFSIFKLSLFFSFLNISSIFFFFYLSEYFTILQHYNFQLISHLTFRLSYFIWVFLTLFDFNSFNFFLLLSLIITYFSHNIFLFFSISIFNSYFFLFHSFSLILLISFFLLFVFL